MKLKRWKVTYLVFGGIECADYVYAVTPQGAANGMVSESNLKYWYPISLKDIVRVELAP